MPNNSARRCSEPSLSVRARSKRLLLGCPNHTGTRGKARSHVAAQALKMNARLARTHGGSALLASGERALPHCALPGLIKNQIFKFRENLPGVSRKFESDSVCTKPPPTGNPDSVRVRGAKKTRFCCSVPRSRSLKESFKGFCRIFLMINYAEFLRNMGKTKKTPNPIDKHVGKRLRMQRRVGESLYHPR
jgi:hypothetical protein